MTAAQSTQEADLKALPRETLEVYEAKGKLLHRIEAMKNVQEAVEAYLESLKVHDEPVPPSITEEVIEVAV